MESLLLKAKQGEPGAQFSLGSVIITELKIINRQFIGIVRLQSRGMHQLNII